jgi:hypothetical protein
MPNTTRSFKEYDMTSSTTALPLPLPIESPSVTCPIDSYTSSRNIIESVSHKLGSFAGRSVSYMKSKQGKRRSIQAYILSESLITAIAVISMFLAGIYWPAILLSLMLAYLIYAAIDII